MGIAPNNISDSPSSGMYIPETDAQALPLCAEPDGRVVLGKVSLALAAGRRMKGLIGRRELPDGAGMFFPHCRMIHSFFMSISLDVVFLGAAGEVLDLVVGLAPWRIAFCRTPGGCHTLELAAGGAKRRAIRIGDCLYFAAVDSTRDLGAEGCPSE